MPALPAFFLLPLPRWKRYRISENAIKPMKRPSDSVFHRIFVLFCDV
jgi:hypothetical protein